MQPEQIEHLRQVFADVVSSLTFMLCEEAQDDELPAAPAANLTVTIEFRGPLTGRIVLIAPDEICTELATNVLGLDDDEELSDEMAHDALKELLNVTCGQWLTAVAGDQPVFDLTVPSISTVDGRGWVQAVGQADSIAFLVDDNPVLVQLVVDNHPAEQQAPAA